MRILAWFNARYPEFVTTAQILFLSSWLPEVQPLGTPKRRMIHGSLGGL